MAEEEENNEKEEIDIVEFRKDNDEKFVKDNDIKVFRSSYEMYDGRKKKAPTKIQSIINSITRYKYSSNKMAGFYAKGGYSENEKKFYDLVASTRVFSKKINIPKTLCINPISIYIKLFPGDNYNYLTNDLLMWLKLFNDRINGLKENKDFDLKNHLCFFTSDAKEVNIVSGAFKLNEDGGEDEIKYGYNQDFDTQISCPAFDDMPADAASVLFDSMGPIEDMDEDDRKEVFDKEDAAEIFNEAKKDLEVEEQKMVVSGVEYTVREYGQYVLIFNSNLKLGDDLYKTFSQKDTTIYKEKNEFKAGLKKTKTSRICYFQQSNVVLSNFSSAVVILPEDVKIPVQALLRLEVDPSKLADTLFSLYHIVEDEYELKLMKETREKYKLKVDEDKKEVKKNKKGRKVKKFVGVKKSREIDEKKKEELEKKKKEEEERMKYRKAKDYGMYFEMSYREKKSEFDKIVCPINPNFIFWTNIPSCYEFIGSVGFSGGFSASLTDYFCFIFKHFSTMKQQIYLVRKKYYLFEKIVTNFYDCFSTRIQYDRLRTLDSVIGQFYKYNSSFKRTNIINRVRDFFEMTKYYNNMINNFLKDDYADKLVDCIKAVVNQIIELDSEDLEKHLQEAGVLCLTVFYDGEKAMIPTLRSPNGFLGRVSGKITAQEALANAQIYMQNLSTIRYKKMIESENRQDDISDIMNINAKRIENMLYTQSGLDKESAKKAEGELRAKQPLYDAVFKETSKMFYETNPENREEIIEKKIEVPGFDNFINGIKLKNDEYVNNVQKDLIDAQSKMNDIESNLSTEHRGAYFIKKEEKEEEKKEDIKQESKPKKKGKKGKNSDISGQI